MPSLMNRQFVDFLTPVDFEPDKQTFCVIDSATSFGWVVGPDGEPVRLQGTRVTVPVYDWPANHDELIAMCLVRAAEASPIKVANVQALGEAGFWTKIPTPKALLVHPDMVRRFHNPGRPLYAFEKIPFGRVVVLRQAPLVGYYVRQGAKRGVLAHNRQGLRTIEFQTLL